MKRWIYAVLFALGVVLPMLSQAVPAIPPAVASTSASTSASLSASTSPVSNPQNTPPGNPWLDLMTKAVAHARQHGALTPLLSPIDRTVAPAAFAASPSPATTLTAPTSVPVQQLHAMGVRIVPWTTNDPEKMRAVLRTGVDGLISDRPDLLQQAVAQQRAADPTNAHWQHFFVSAHRGGRGLRPENTLPSFESGLDQLATELETDTGVSTDGVSLIWHDQFYDPQSCRHADGSPYTLANRTYLRDISSTDAQQTFICDKLHSTAFPDQRNDLALSPVAVAFAVHEGMRSPYAPTSAAQLFRFVRFYADFYTTGPGKTSPHAAERAGNARTVRFNLETKLYPDDLPLDVLRQNEPGVPDNLLRNHTQGPQAFVDALAGTITREHMTDRCSIQSFDFRTLLLTAEQYPRIPTIYLTASPAMLSTAMIPAALRTKP